MSRFIEISENMDGVSFLVNSKHQIICIKCDACGKFIKNSWTKWYCPHCTKTFLVGVTFEEMQEIDDILNTIGENYGIISP